VAERPTRVTWVPKAGHEGYEAGYYWGRHVADLVRSLLGAWYVAPPGATGPGTRLHRAETRAEAVAWAEERAERLSDPELYTEP